MPSVSICVPTYNGARYLEECLDSVLCQTFEDFEILLVDDGSYDDTYSILTRYQEIDKRIRLYRNSTNLGLVGNWNRCIELARGEWIKFLFQDDLIEPKCIEKLLDATAAGKKFVACSRRFMYEGGESRSIKEFYDNNKRMIDGHYQNTQILSAEEYASRVLDDIGANIVGEPTVTLIHKSIFQKYGPFNERLIMSCDLEFWTRIGVNEGICFVPEELAVFRVHGGATSAENRRSRKFRMNVLDNLAILNDIVFEPSYRALRKVAIKRTPSVDLNHMLMDKANIARAIAGVLGRELDSADGDGLWSELESFLELYPRVRVGWLQHIYWCIRNRQACGKDRLLAKLIG